MRPYLSLILACYNEAEHLRGSFKRIFSVLKQLKISYEIIFIDDVSQDNTVEIVKKLVDDYKKKKINFRLIFHTINRGRGKSVSDGIRSARGQIAGYLDVDLEVGPEYIPKALELLNKYDLVVGKREFPFSFKTIHRYLASKIYAWSAKSILNLPVSDSEAGFKFFNRAEITKVFPYLKSNGWFWDTEIIAVANLFKLKIKEMPVRYIRRTDKTSTVSTFKDSIIYLWNLIKFKMKYNSIKTKY